MATTYIVLRETGKDTWAPFQDGVQASNDMQAIRAATSGLDAQERTGTFVAVPARSFRPRTRIVTTIEKDEWS